MFRPGALADLCVPGRKETHSTMKKAILTAAFAALALGAAQAVTIGWKPSSYDWTSTNTNNKTLNLSNGCGTVVAIISTPDTFNNNRSSIFTVQDGLHSSYTGNNPGTTFRMSGTGGATSNGKEVGVTAGQGDVTFDGTGTVTTEASQKYLLSIVYNYDAATQTMTATCYVNTTVVGTFSGSLATPPESFAITNINSYGAGTSVADFFKLEEMSGYDAALSEAQIAWLTQEKPEPTALALLALGVAGVALRRKVA